MQQTTIIYLIAGLMPIAFSLIVTITCYQILKRKDLDKKTRTQVTVLFIFFIALLLTLSTAYIFIPILLK